MKNETAREKSMSRPQSKRLRLGGSLDTAGGSGTSSSRLVIHVPACTGSAAAWASVRAHNFLPVLGHGLLLASGDHRSGAIGVIHARELRGLQDERALQDHLHGCSGGDDDFVAAGEQGVDGAGSCPGKRTIANSFGEVSRGSTAEDTALGAHGGSFEDIAYVAALVAGLLDCAFISLDLGTVGTGKAVEDAGNFDDLAVGKNHGGEVEVELSSPFHSAGANHAVDRTLHIDAYRDHDAGGSGDGEGRDKVDAVSLLGGFGIDGAAQGKKNFGAGRYGVGLRGGFDRRWGLRAGLRDNGGK